MGGRASARELITGARAWSALAAELDAWAAMGAPATMWWRDDDASVPHAGLERLLAMTAAHGVPVALAAIPALTEASLLPLLAGHPSASILIHGYAHVNHARPGAKKCELGSERPVEKILAELAQGRVRLRTLFGARALPVLVPPWNRVSTEVVARLASAGFTALSTFRARPNPWAAPGVRLVNTHLDPVDWRGGQGFIGLEPALAALVGHLQARRAGAADRDEPTGIITHHRQTDEAGWAFFGELLARLGGHDAVSWQAGETVFAISQTAAA
jgi:peptidoglycan/xylan/chitin deacetylase (PgdA/CDA1 family)